MAEADGARWAEADSANIAAVKRGLNNIAEVNEHRGNSWEVYHSAHAS